LLTGVDVLGAKKVTNEQIKAALTAHDGVIPRAAEALTISNQGLHQRIRRSTDLQNHLLEMEEGLKDMAQGNIYRALKAGDMRTVRWFADRKMRDQGYGSRPPEPTIETDKIEAIIEVIGRYGGAPAIREIRAILASR
jgi:hypothetical protein